MAQKINYDQFGPAFIKEAIHPFVIQKSINKAIQPRRISDSMDQGPAKVFYTAYINDVQASYTNTLGVYHVVIPIDIEIEVRAVISKKYLLKALVPFQLIAETYAPLALFFNYTPVSAAAVNVNGSASGGDLIYKKVVEAIPPVLATEVNKALAASHGSRFVDVLKSVNQSLNSSSFRSSVALKASEVHDLKPITVNHLREQFEAAPTEIESNDDGEALFQVPSFNSAEEFKLSYPEITAMGAPQRLNYSQFGIEFIRLVLHPNTVLKEINKAIAKERIKADIAVMEGHSVQYVAVIDPAALRAVAYGQFEVTLTIKINLAVNVAGGWNEAWHIVAKVPFGMQVVPYSNPLMTYLLVIPVNRQNIQIQSKQQTWTGLGWGKVEEGLLNSLTTEVNKALNESNKDRSINIAQRVMDSMNTLSVELPQLTTYTEQLSASSEVKQVMNEVVE